MVSYAIDERDGRTSRGIASRRRAPHRHTQPQSYPHAAHEGRETRARAASWCTRARTSTPIARIVCRREPLDRRLGRARGCGTTRDAMASLRAPERRTGATGLNATSRPVAEGEREYGRIVTLKESFGFIRCGASIGDWRGARSRGGPLAGAGLLSAPEEFHRELPNRDKPALDPGDLVKFIVAPSPKETVRWAHSTCKR